MGPDGRTSDAALLQRLERYLDEVPRGGAAAEDFGSLIAAPPASPLSAP